MDNGHERPRPGPPPLLTSPVDILKSLLAIEQDRLEVAVKIEKSRQIVFPETSVIIRDIMRLTLEIEKREAGGGSGQKGQPDDWEINFEDL